MAIRPIHLLGSPVLRERSPDVPVVDDEFAKFSEAVYLIGQAAKRFIEQPQPQAQAGAQRVANRAAPSTAEIDALSAVLRETVSAFRSVADDLAVSAGEIRHHATREERMPPRRRPFAGRSAPATVGHLTSAGAIRPPA